ncbi:hypothetical protein Tco_1411400 [Tanacetum coccineum]
MFLLASSSNKESNELFLTNQLINPLNHTFAQQPPISTSMPTNFQSTQLLNQPSQNEYFSNNLDNMNCQPINENIMPTCIPENHVIVHSQSDQFKAQSSDTSSFQTSDIETKYQPTNQNFNYDSVLSTPMSSPTPLNSSSTLVNSSSTDDDRETYCSMFKFEIPESFEFDDFM